MSLRTLVAAVAATAVTFAVLEGVAWLAFRSGALVRSTAPVVEYPYHPYLGWDNQPNFTYSGVLAGGLHRWSVTTDSAGTVGTPLFQFVNPGVRVVLTGGSAAFGHGQTGNRHTVAAQLESVLCRRTGLEVEVTNLAVRGYTSFQEAGRLERHLAGHRADVVASLSGFNDGVAAALEDGRNFGLLLNRPDPKVELLRSIERGELAVIPVAANLVVRALRRSSHAVDLLGKVAERVAPAPGGAPPPWAGVPVPDSAESARRALVVRANYAAMHAMSEQNGARYFMFLQPTAMTKRRLTATESQAMDSLDRALMDRVVPTLEVFYSTLRTAPKRFDFHDLSGCFDGFEGSAFGDDCHYLDAGTPVIAAAIAERILPAVVEAGRRSPPRPGRHE